MNFEMSEIVMALIAIFGLGITVGIAFTRQTPILRPYKTFCEIAHWCLAEWPLVLISDSGKRETTNCPYFNQKNKNCNKIQKKCILFVDFNYDEKYKTEIEKVKIEKQNR